MNFKINITIAVLAILAGALFVVAKKNEITGHDVEQFLITKTMEDINKRLKPDRQVCREDFKEFNDKNHIVFEKVACIINNQGYRRKQECNADNDEYMFAQSVELLFLM